jgi:hypothetical protein
MADYHMAGEPLSSRLSFDYIYQQPGSPHARTLELHSNSELVEYSAHRSVLLTFRTFYYPGWHAYLVDPETKAIVEELPIALRGKLGLITVRVPSGVGNVLLRFEDTPLRKAGTAVTFGCLLLVGLVSAVCLTSRVSSAKERPPGSTRASDRDQ